MEEEELKIDAAAVVAVDVKPDRFSGRSLTQGSEGQWVPSVETRCGPLQDPCKTNRSIPGPWNCSTLALQ